MVKKIVKSHEGDAIAKETASETADASSSEIVDESDDMAVLESLQRSLVLDNKVPRGQRRTNSIYIKPFAHTAKSRAATSDHMRSLYSSSSSGGNNTSGPISVLDGHKLSLLLLERPELAEFLYLEIMSLKTKG